MSKWLIIDRLYNASAYWCGHLDSYGHYLREAGEEVARIDLAGHLGKNRVDGPVDIVFALEGYDFALTIPAKKRIAQVACDLEVPRGFDAIVSSIPALVDKYKARGDNAIYWPLAFDARARVAGMGVKRDLGCIFIGSTGANHVRRTELLRHLKDVVTVLPPVFGREYFRTLARARAVFNVHAEWARGAANNMRIWESLGMGCGLFTDGKSYELEIGWEEFVDANSIDDCDLDELRDRIRFVSELDHDDIMTDDDAAERDLRDMRDATARVLLSHTYESRIPGLISLARSL